MKIIHKLSLFWVFMIIIANPQYSHSQTFKICSEGVKRCKPLIGKEEKYKECMQLVCYDFYFKKKTRSIFEERKKRKNIRIVKPKEKPVVVMACEYGQRKCDSYRSNQVLYWYCVDSECKNPPQQSRPADCERGKKLCSPELGIYGKCTEINCGRGEEGSIKTCKKSQVMCTDELTDYWQCVYKYCLGDVSHYTRANIPDKRRYIINTAGQKREILARSGEPAIPGGGDYKIPKKFNPDEWVRQTPPELLSVGNPADDIKCVLPGAVLNCRNRDVRSCRCSDGSKPIFMKGVPQPVSFD
jgi:hypothetical protein